MWMLAERRVQPLRQSFTLPAHRGKQTVAPDHLLNGQRRGAGDRMADVRVAVLEQPAAVGQRLGDAPLREHRADRLIAAPETLGDRQQVRHDAFLLARVQGTGTAHAAHHLVEDQQDAVAVAQLADAAQVARHRRQRAGGRADHRLGDKSDHVGAADTLDRVGQLAHEAFAVRLRRFVVAPVAIFVAWRDVRDVDQQRRELRAPPRVAAHRQCAERVAVIALAARDEVPALRFAALDEVLPRHLQRRLDGFRPAADEVGVAHAGRRMRDQIIGQCLGDLSGEEARVCVGEAIDLRMHRGEHVAMRMPEARHRRAARRVEVSPPIGIDQRDAVAGDGGRQRELELPMQHAGGMPIHAPASVGRRHQPHRLRQLLGHQQRVASRRAT